MYLNIKNTMKNNPKTNCLPDSVDVTKTDFSPCFWVYMADLKEHKIEYLSFLVTIQRLLLKEASQNDWTKEQIETIDNNLLVLQQLILNA